MRLRYAAAPEHLASPRLIAQFKTRTFSNSDTQPRIKTVPTCALGQEIESDWNVFLGHAAATLVKFKVPESEQRDVVAFVQSLKKEIVE